jgi:hypothetical protein
MPEPTGGTALFLVGGCDLVTAAGLTGVRARARIGPAVLRVCAAAAVTAVLIALLGWLLFETQGGDMLGLAERLTTAAQTSWPFIVALALRRTPRRPSTTSWPACVGGFTVTGGRCP